MSRTDLVDRRNLRTAQSVSGVLSHRSAARHWGWAQKDPDGLAEVTVPRTRKVARSLRTILIPHWSDLPEEDVEDGVTSRRRTLVDCFRNLPFDEALAIGDSAVRAGDITYDELQELAASTRGRGRTRIMAVAKAASKKPANGFESVLRGQCLLIPGLQVEPQVRLEISGKTMRPDVVDIGLMMVGEAEGFEWHGKSAELTRDCRRYNAFVANGWLVVRFSWYLVMHDPAYVQRALLELVAEARRRSPRHANVARAA